MGPKVWIVIGIEALVFIALLFGSAGTLDWPAGWAFMLLFFGTAIPMTWSLGRTDPDLLRERMKPFVQKGQPVWDQVLMSAFAVGYVGWLVLMALDAKRFGWSFVPLWLQVAGGVGVVVTMGACFQALRENTFTANVVKIQSERGHTVVSTGPYALVRHPMYAAVLVMFPCTALLLGSWYGVAAGAVLCAGLVVRTALEDRELHLNLLGYREYAQHVRYRLIPGVW